MKKKFKFILSFALVALIAVTALTGCNDDAGGKPETQTQTQSQSEAKTQESGNTDDGVVSHIGDGETVFLFEVTDDKGEVSTWNVNTNQKTVGAALLETGLIEGEESEYGLYVKTVNGVAADYDVDQSYWAFYIDGDYAMTGVDETDIEPDKTYAFVYTKE